MILIDFNGVAISGVMVQLKGSSEFDEDLIRHIILNNLRHARTKYRSECGDMVICCDGPNSWRRSIFPYYKAGRRTAREASTFDWGRLFQIVDKIRLELESDFPYRVLKQEGLEADDLIGALVIYEPGPHAIVSNDKDFFQLLKFPNVSMYSPLKSSEIICSAPERFLIEQIIKGDKGDGIPNVLSDGDTFVSGKRQSPIRTKKLEEWINSRPEDIFSPEILDNYRRNEKLISLFKIPDAIKDKALEAFHNANVNPRSKLLQYFIRFNLRNMLDRITEF
jgi:hypothetical protein